MEEKILEFRNSLTDEQREILDKSINYIEDILPQDEKLSFKTIILNKIDGDFSAKTKKVANILRVDFKKMSKLLLTYGALSQVDEIVSLIIAVLQFLYEIDDQLEIKFSEREAKILFCICSLEERFTDLDIKNKYQEVFGLSLEDFQLNISIDKLEKFKCISKENRTHYRLIEKIIYKEG